MIITVTQALLLLIKARHGGWDPLSKGGSTYLSIENLYDFLLDGPGFDKREYDAFLSEWNALRQSKFLATSLIASKCEIFDAQYFDPLLSNIPTDASKLPANYKYMFPSEYETNPAAFLESYTADQNIPDVANILYDDTTRLVFETTLARNVLAVSLCQETDDILVEALRNWNTKLVHFLKEVRRRKKSSDRFQYGEIERRINLYNTLNSLALPLEPIPKPDSVFGSDWPATWSRPQPHHEVYDIIMITCSAVAQRHDPRLTRNRMELIRQVTLAWLLINTCMKNFNTTLYHYDFLNSNIMVESFRRRVDTREEKKRDRPWPTPDHNPNVHISPQPDLRYDIREVGVIHSRTTLPLHDADAMTHYKFGDPTFFKLPEGQSSYGYRKATEIAHLLNTGAWAKFCRGRKVHPIIGGGSASFFYVFRVLLSTQAASKDNSVFPGYDHSIFPVEHNLNENQIKEFIKILGCLWVGVTGGHCFLEILFIMNLRTMKKSFAEICKTELTSDLPTFLRLKGQRPILSVHNLIHSIKIAADYNTAIIEKKIVNDELNAKMRV